MSTNLFFQTVFLFIFSLILAVMETQIEGRFGWAEKLPTWKPKDDVWYSRLYKKIMPGKVLTGYHLSINSLVLFVMHYPYFLGQDWSWSKEFNTLSLFFLVVVVWDFLWFVVNPYYDFKDFWNKKVWWHKNRFLKLPVDYWVALIISILLYTGVSFNIELIEEWAKILFSFLGLTFIVIAVAHLIGIFNIRKEK